VGQVDVADALEWLPAHTGGGAIATSPPDASELRPEWIIAEPYDHWLSRVLHAVFEASAGPTVLVLTDRKRMGRWESKASMAQRHAGEHGLELLWHRIALRRGVGKVDLHVPTYSHVLAWGPGKPGQARPDVFEQGKPWWPHGVGWDLAMYVAGWLAEQDAEVVMDPFAGTGALLVAAEEHELATLGCELDAGRAALANAYLETQARPLGPFLGPFQRRDMA
jgi:hypothetical protein